MWYFRGVYSVVFRFFEKNSRPKKGYIKLFNFIYDKQWYNCDIFGPIIVVTIACERVAAKMSSGRDEESIAFDTLLFALAQLPSVPSSSPDNMKEGSTTNLSAKHASASLSQRSYLSSLAASSSLPLQLNLSSGTEFLWPLKVSCNIKVKQKSNITIAKCFNKSPDISILRTFMKVTTTKHKGCLHICSGFICRKWAQNVSFWNQGYSVETWNIQTIGIDLHWT